MRKKGPWKIKKSKVVYKNPWIEIVEDEVIRPDGKDGVYTTVDIVSGVSILPVHKGGEITLINNFKYATGIHEITAPGGAIEKDEASDVAAKRELKEETGLTAKNWKYMGKINEIGAIVRLTGHLYIAEDLTEGEMELDGGEDIHHFKIPLSEAKKKVMNGEINDPITALLILKTYFIKKEL